MVSRIFKKRMQNKPDSPIIERTLDGNIRITYRNNLGGIGVRTLDVENGVIDATNIDDDFVEEYLLECLEGAGFKVEYETEDEDREFFARVKTLIFG